MTRPELVKFARDLYATHGLMPVPVSGKIPIGGERWNLLPLETRLQNVNTAACTGVGIQCGLVFHPVLGPLEARVWDGDIDDRPKLEIVAHKFCETIPVSQWRWGRRPATLLFTEPGKIKNEKFGPIQLLGAGKQAVWVGEYRNKKPRPGDPAEYWHEGKSIFEVNPPFVAAERLRMALDASIAAGGYAVPQQSMLSDAAPLSTADIAMLTPAMLADFSNDMKSMLSNVAWRPTGSGRGDILHALGLKYGALIKAGGNAPLLMDAMRSVRSAEDITEFDIVDHHILKEMGEIADSAFHALPGTLSQGDKRDFARGIGISKGLAQFAAVQQVKNPLIMPTGREHPGQLASDLMKENLPPIKYIVDKYLPDVGCILLAGKPKVGKGWIILELGLAIASGNTFWGQQCQQGSVMLYMLEDGKRRIQQRLNMLRPQFDHWDKLRFRYAADGPFFINADGKGTLLDDIRNHLAYSTSIKLVVVDVLQRVRGTIDRSDNAYQVDYKVVGALQKLAHELNILIVVVHHTKKGKVDDAIDSVSGSFGLSGAADGLIVVGKDIDGKVTANSSMRDIPDYEFELLKEDNSPMWKPAQTVQEMRAPSEGTKTQSVLMALFAAKCVLTAGDISKRTGIPENQVAAYLTRLQKTDQVVRSSRGYYMAHGLPYRERIEGVIDLIRRMPKIPATPELKHQYAPDTAPPEATFMLLTEPTIKEIEGSFVNGKNALTSLKLRRRIVFNTDTIWLLGDDWDEKKPPYRAPYQQKQTYPWEASP
jgi:hypothetical protein